MATAAAPPRPVGRTSGFGEDSLDDIFHQFEVRANSDHSFSPRQSQSGASEHEVEGDYNFDPEMMAYLAGQGMGIGGAMSALAGAPAQQQHYQDGNSLYGQSNQGGFEPYTNGNTSSSSGLSNASSPYSYSVPGSSNHSNYDNTNGSSPPYNLTSDGMHLNSVSAGMPAFSEASFVPTYSDASYATLAQLTSKAPPPQPMSAYTNFVGQPTSNSLSPPSSSTSPNGGFQNSNNANNGFAHNSALAKMIADSQARQTSNISQAYSVPTQQLYSNGFSPQNVSPATFTNSFSESLYPPSLSYSSDSTGISPVSARTSDEGDSGKKRKLASEEVPLRKSVGSGARVPRGHITSSNTLSTSQPHPLLQNNVQAFDFSTKPPSIGNAAAGLSTSSVDLISNAGISHDMKKSYQLEDKVPMDRPNQAGTKASAAAATKALKAAEKKAATAKKGADKKKKADKGHNAVERRYRNNINNAIATLRDIVPALRHLKPLPSMPASRRRASQFTLSTAAQAPTPSGLIDGIPAAKTLSKGTILGKSIEYIQYLQGARVDAAEDVEIFKAVVNEMVAGGSNLIQIYEQRRALREEQRETTREAERREQALLDEEDSDDEDEAVKAEYHSDPDQEIAEEQYQQQAAQANYHAQPSLSHLDGLAQLRQHLAGAGAGTYSANSHLNSYMPPEAHRNHQNGFPPSPVSSSEDTSISPRMMMAQQQYRGHASGPPRVLLASFMGLSFAGGLGYDWTYGMAEEASDVVGAKAWAGRLVRRAGSDASLPAPSALISSDIVQPALLTGLLFLAVASIVASAIFLLYPLVGGTPPSSLMLKPVSDDKDVDPRNIYRQQRRADALASLATLTESNSANQTCEMECKSALKARKELLRLVGAPTYGLLPALLKEALSTALRNVTTIQVGTFSKWDEKSRIEAAAAWVRCAEIEATVGADDINYLARCYTFLRLFNLSRSSSWPCSTSSTSRASVNAVLAIHLNSLGQPLSAHALWNKAAKADNKKSDVPLEPWVEIAISTDFEQVREVLASSREQSSISSPSDTVPLLRISEVRCEAALREAWAKIFAAVVQTTCPPHSPLSSIAAFSSLVNKPLLEETIAHVLASTAAGTTVHSLAKVTRALCAYYNGKSQEASDIAQDLAHEARADGPLSRLGCSYAFFTLLLDNPNLVDPIEPTTEVDILATTTLGWLAVRRQAGNGEDRKADPVLHAQVLGVRRLFGAKVFSDATLELDESMDLIGEALTDITRKAAGLSPEVE